LALIGTNLFDELYATYRAQDKPLGKPGTVTTFAAPPRQVTLQLTARF
jgi:outer membrane receptor protein involved in Fe transport